MTRSIVRVLVAALVLVGLVVGIPYIVGHQPLVAVGVSVALVIVFILTTPSTTREK
jgi:hypothetical protein